MLYRFFFCLSFLGWQCASAQSIDPTNITIVRDTFGVPHIFAPTDAEVAYGLAYAHAEDDFGDIQESLLAGRGILGEVQGMDGVLFDFAMKFLKIDSLVDAQFERDLSPEYRKLLDGYIQGINAFAEAHPKEIVHKKLFPAGPKDLVRGYTLTLSIEAGLGMALKSVIENRIAEFFTANDQISGSNAFAVSADKMDDGKSYLLVNSHQPIEGRFAWYEAHVNSDEGWNMAGGLFAGGVTIFVGANENLGWAHTVNYHQFGDIYQLEINPKNKNQYMYNGKWRDFYVKKVKLKVKLAGMRIPVKRKIRWSTHGPTWKTKHGIFAFRFPGATDIRAGEQWYKMNKAKNLEEFTDILKMQAIPQYNTVYADADGSVLMHSMGKIADRNPKLDWTQPISSTSSEFLWDKLVPFDKLPYVANPECGYVFNANNSPLNCTGTTCEEGDFFVGMQTFTYNRGERLNHLFSKHDGKFSEDDLNRIKFDTKFNDEGEYQNHFKVMFELDEAKYPDIADAIRKIKAWDRGGETDNPHAALIMVVHDELRHMVNGPFALLMIRKQPITEEMAVDAIRKAKKFFIKKHGTMDLKLGDVQQFMRGDKRVEAHGLREVLRATDTHYKDKKNGIYKAAGGDGYIQIARFSKEKGTEIRSVNVYGASDRPDSPHYDDQMEMFRDHKYKTIPLDRKAVEASAERIYHPGE